MAERVCSDGIDVLIDLHGHTAGSLLPVFVDRPAPVQSAWQENFATTGVAAARLQFASGATHRDFLDAYREVDIALDVSPYSGGLTTCEALYMGVPVVTLRGDRPTTRHSASHLTSAGLAKLVAIASRLAADLDALKVTDLLSCCHK